MVTQKYKIFKLALLFLITTSVQTKAQIVPDTSLPNNSEVTREGNIFLVEEGTTRGSNLFHSFKEFTVPTNLEASFNNASNIQNILTRVTGGSISEINGLIKANGNANLFFVNPSGIIFGANARLDIGGSFISSTAEKIVFADGFEFNALNPTVNSPLTVTVPVGLGFNRPMPITVEGSGHNDVNPMFGNSNIQNLPGLQVQPNQTVALLGGNLFFEGGVVTADRGKVELASIGKGTVHFDFSPSRLGFKYNNVTRFGDIQLISRSLVNTSGGGNTSVNVHGRNIRLADGSYIRVKSQNLPSRGDLQVNASEKVVIEGFSVPGNVRSGLFSQSLGVEQGKNIVVNTPFLLIREAGGITTATYSTAKAGDINISAQKIQIESSGLINSSTFLNGEGGNLIIDASESVKIQGASLRDLVDQRSFFDGESSLFSSLSSSTISSTTFNDGKGGNLYLNSSHLDIQDGGSIGTLTFGNGNSGDAFVNISDTAKLIGTSSSRLPSVIIANSFSSGNAGSLSINSSKIFIQNGATIGTSALADGDAGDLLVNASESIEVKGISLNSINTSSIDSSASFVDQSLREAFNLPASPQGNAGSIKINTPTLRILDGAQVGVLNQSVGNAGTLSINADSIFLNNAGKVTASTVSGQGGNITLTADSLRLRNDSFISATAGGAGDGGNITIDGDTISLLQNSDILANAVQGRGGNIQINTDALLQSPDSDIDASSQLGIDGEVTINTPESTLEEEIQQRQTELDSTDQLLAQSCLTQRNAQRGSFTYTGRGGQRVRPGFRIDEGDQVGASPTALETSQVEEQPEEAVPVGADWQPGDPIVEGSRGVRTADGRVFLVAEAQIQSADSLICFLSSSGGEKQRSLHQ